MGYCCDVCIELNGYMGNMIFDLCSDDGCFFNGDKVVIENMFCCVLFGNWIGKGGVYIFVGKVFEYVCFVVLICFENYVIGWFCVFYELADVKGRFYGDDGMDVDSCFFFEYGIGCCYGWMIGWGECWCRCCFGMFFDWCKWLFMIGLFVEYWIELEGKEICNYC